MKLLKSYSKVNNLHVHSFDKTEFDFDKKSKSKHFVIPYYVLRRLLAFTNVTCSGGHMSA